MKRLVYLTLMSVLTWFSLNAERISRDVAISVANAEVPWHGQSPHGMSKVADGRFSKVVAETDAYYVLTTSAEKGFAIVSADDCMPNMLAGYSPDHRFPADRSSLPPQLKAWLHDYSAIVKAVAEGRLTLKAPGPELKGEAVAPLLKTKWNQDMPYNNFAPLFGSDRAPSGCVATAATQVMKFFNFPSKGKGTVTAYPYDANSEKIDISADVYDWDNMLEVYETNYDYDKQTYVPANFNEAQGTAVATLMRDFGYSVNMGYGATESAAYSYLILPALVRHFSYSPDAHFINRGNQTEAQWSGDIRRSLLAGSPVLYGGRDATTGHEFVCDGIDENGLLHINWGWGGVSDGYFDMNILSPENLGIGAGNGAYYRDQDVILFLKPGNEDIDNSSYRAPLSLRYMEKGSTDENGKLDRRTSKIFTAEFHNTSDVSISRGSLKYFLTLTDMNGNTVYQNREKGSSDINLAPGYYYYSNTTTFSFDSGINSADIPDGEYKVVPQYAYISSGTLGETRDFVKDREYIRLIVKNGDFYLDKPSGNKTTIEVTGASASLLFAATNQTFPVVVSVKSTTDIFQSATFSYCLIHEDDDTGVIPAADAVSWGYGYPTLYPGATIGTTVNVRGSWLTKAGRYRMYFRQYETDISPKEPVWLTSMEAPADGFVLAKPLGDVSLPVSDGIGFSLSLTPFVSAKSYDGKVQTWAYPEGCTAADAFLLSTDNVDLRSGEEAWLGPSAQVMLDKPLGKYTLFLKYMSGGQWKTVPGFTNNGTLDFYDDGKESYVMELKSEAKIGENHEASPGDEIDIEYRLTCRSDLNFTDPSIMLFCRDAENPTGDISLIEGVPDLSISSSTITKGDEFVIKGKVKVSRSLDCGTGKTYVITPAIYDRDGGSVYYSTVRSYPYGESMKLRVTPLAAEHVDVSVHSFEPFETFQPGEDDYVVFVARMTNKADATLNSTRFNFYPVRLGEETDSPDFENLPHGTYFTTDFAPGSTFDAHVTMRGEMFPSHGVYRIYVTYEDSGRQVPLTGFDPIYVNTPGSIFGMTVKSVSDENIMKYLEPDVNFNISLTLSCPIRPYSGPLELWVRPSTGGPDMCIHRVNTSVAAGSPQQKQFEASSDAFLNMPLGYYDCYFKIEAEGKMVRAEGENNKLAFFFSGVKEGSQVLELMNVALSSGSTIPQDEETEISVRVYANGPVSLDYSKAKIELIDEETGEPVNAEGGAIEGPAVIAQGSYQTLKAKVKLPVDASAVGRMLIIRPELPTTDNGFCTLRTYPNESLLRVRQTEAVVEIPEQVDVTVNSFDPLEKFKPGDKDASVTFLAKMTNNADTPLNRTRFNFYPVRLGEGTDSPDFENLPHGTCLPTEFLPGSTYDANVTMRGDMFPSYGLYRIYVTYEESDRQVPLAGVAPIYTTIGSPSGIVVESASDENTTKYLEPDVNFNIDLILSSANSYSGPLELWVRPSTGGEEMCIHRLNTSVAAGRPQQMQIEASSGAFLNLPFGDYECYFKVEADGNMLKADGENNNLAFALAGVKDGSQMLEFTAMSFSSGSWIYQGEETEISLRVHSFAPLSLDYSQARVVLVDEESGEPIDAGDGAIEGPALIAQDDYETLKAKVRLPVDASAVGKMFIISPVLPTTDGGFCKLRTYPNEDLLRTMQMAAKAGVAELPADICFVRLDGKILRIDNADSGSMVGIYSANGILCLQQIAMTDHMGIRLDALPDGFYFVRLTAGGKPYTSKIILK